MIMIMNFEKVDLKLKILFKKKKKIQRVRDGEEYYLGQCELEVGIGDEIRQSRDGIQVDHQGNQKRKGQARVHR